MLAQRHYLGDLAKGGGAALFLLWLVLSFGPPVDLYRSISDMAWGLNVLFLLTSLPVLIAAYLLVRYLAAAGAKPLFDRWMVGHVPHLAVFGALWIFLYTVLV